MKPKTSIVLMADSSTPSSCITTAEEGIRETIGIVGTQLKIHIITQSQHAPFIPPEYQETWGNPDWHVQTTSVQSSENLSGRLNADNLLTLFEESILNKLIDPYTIFLTGKHAYSTGCGHLLGWYRENSGAVVSIEPLKDLKEVTRKECAKTLIMHVLGHTFGLIPMTRFTAFEDRFGKHCTNTCIMRQPLLNVDVWMKLTRDRLTGEPFCRECTENLKDYFK